MLPLRDDQVFAYVITFSGDVESSTVFASPWVSSVEVSVTSFVGSFTAVVSSQSARPSPTPRAPSYFRWIRHCGQKSIDHSGMHAPLDFWSSAAAPETGKPINAKYNDATHFSMTRRSMDW